MAAHLKASRASCHHSWDVRHQTPLVSQETREDGVWSGLARWTGGFCCWFTGPVLLYSSHQQLQVSLCYHGCHTVSLADHPPDTQDNSQSWVSLPAPAWYANPLFSLGAILFPAWSLKLWTTAALRLHLLLFFFSCPKETGLQCVVSALVSLCFTFHLKITAYKAKNVLNVGAAVHRKYPFPLWFTSVVRSKDQISCYVGCTIVL